MSATPLIHLAIEDAALGSRLEEELRRRGHRVVLTSTVDETRRRMSADAPDLIVCRFSAARAAPEELCLSLREYLVPERTRVLLLDVPAGVQKFFDEFSANVHGVAAGSVDDGRLIEWIEALLVEDPQEGDRSRLDQRGQTHMAPVRTKCQFETLEAVGRLAGVVAHDFNNILMVVKGFSDVLEKSFETGDKRRRFVGEITKATNRAAELCDRLTLIAGRDNGRLTPVPLLSALEELRPQLEQTVGTKVLLRVDCAPDVGMIAGEPAQLKQVISSVCLNACEAMPDGGQLTIAARRLEAGESDTKSPAKTVVLEVRDTGSGMNRETMAHIFEPYFTTRTEHDGLGLTIACGIMKHFGGRIECSSVFGTGTTVEIYFKNIETGDGTDAGK